MTNPVTGPTQKSIRTTPPSQSSGQKPGRDGVPLRWFYLRSRRPARSTGIDDPQHSFKRHCLRDSSWRKLDLQPQHGLSPRPLGVSQPSAVSRKCRIDRIDNRDKIGRIVGQELSWATLVDSPATKRVSQVCVGSHERHDLRQEKEVTE